MSSVYVRDQIKAFLASESPSETVIDLTDQFVELQEMISNAGISYNAPWLGLEFIGEEETPVTSPATNDKGIYREFGAVQFHVVAEARAGAVDDILTRAENLKNIIRGRRINDIMIDSMTMTNFSDGATLQFEGGYTSGTFIVGYRRDLNL